MSPEATEITQRLRLNEEQLLKSAELLARQDNLKLTFNYTDEEKRRILDKQIKEIERFVSIMQILVEVLDDEQN